MSGKSKNRLDVVLVDRGFYESCDQAQRAILAGDVMVGTDRTVKAGTKIPDDAEITVARPAKYVSRGGFKLEGALEKFGVPVENRIAVDIGASTGGFTDVLLQRGVAHVFCIDVGTNQLAYRIREDPRVEAREQINARYLEARDFRTLPDLCVIDVSFISLTMILPAVERILAAPGDVITLIKPQFELTREQVGKGGIVQNEKARLSAVEKIRNFVGSSSCLVWQDWCESPILGTEGNKEFLAWIKKSPSA